MGEGKYLYCFIKSPVKKQFDVEGIAGNGSKVYTINHKDLAAVVCDSPNVSEYKLSRENTIHHELVLGKVLEDFTVLPVGFGTVTEGAELIREKALKKNYEELHQLLDEMDGKVELTLKALWKHNRIIHQEVLKADPGIKNRLDKMISTSKMDLSQVILSSTKLGERLIQAIDKIKKCYTERMLASIEQIAEDKRLKKIFSPLMIFNTAFLINRDKEDEFDRKVNELDQRYSRDIKFIYTGPLAPYSFVNFRIALE
ncbi:MAG: gas vesicle protein [Candidatus Scalindua rubra]|uniref:Gas vesicle protein n=1 Tax=Candidatus Scalindua rubra TaxID=1872076 RepID=A0A1E3XD08_9BACT|nr:MAG: gas vesicle protein [Candidatus Scalindua rubra]